MLLGKLNSLSLDAFVNRTAWQKVSTKKFATDHIGNTSQGIASIRFGNLKTSTKATPSSVIFESDQIDST